MGIWCNAKAVPATVSSVPLGILFKDFGPLSVKDGKEFKKMQARRPAAVKN